MLTQRRFVKLLILLMALSLLIAACDRPLPTADDNDNETTQTNDNDNGYPPPVVVEPTAVGGNTATDPTAQPGEGEAPAEATPETPAEAGEGDPAEAEVPAEVTPDASSETAEGEVPAEATPEADAAGEGEGEASEAEVPAEAEGEAAEGGEAESETGDTEQPAESDEGEAPAEAEEETTQSAPEALPATHTVAAGENLYRIGLQYGISWVAIAEANGITNPDRIYAGQVIDIPGGESGTGGQPQPMPTPEGINYLVKPGDTLFKIAQRYNISWTEIAEANGLVNPNEIYAGQMIKIPVDGPMPPQTVHHVVESGETLFRISLHYGVSWLAIAHANNISAPYRIYAGQTLIIPGGGN